MHNSSVSLPIMRDSFTVKERIRILKDRAVQGWLKLWNMGVAREHFSTMTIAVPLRKLTNEERLGLLVAIFFSGFLALVLAASLSANLHQTPPSATYTNNVKYHVILPKHPCAWYHYPSQPPAQYHCVTLQPPKAKKGK